MMRRCINLVDPQEHRVPATIYRPENPRTDRHDTFRHSIGTIDSTELQKQVGQVRIEGH